MAGQPSLAEEIQRYLTEHPHAADDIDGIASWWLTRQRYEAGHEQVAQALEELEKRGLVRRVLNPDGRVLFTATEPE